MARMKRGAMVASTLMLVAIITSACNQPYSQKPSVTNTPIDQNSLFSTPIGKTPDITMSDVANFGTGTANALLTTTPGTPVPAGVTPQASATLTSTPIINLPPTATPTATLAVANGPSLTPVTPGPHPPTYTLHRGEFPFCIARRFDVDPDELLAANGLTYGDVYYAGQDLNIPQTGHPFPPPRALRSHTPGQIHTVTADEDTVYAVACYYGDVYPEAIAQTNKISVDTALTAGQQLNIP